MLNTNSTNTEPKVKELLLERRHSICLEVSKKRRQSVASSIFIPKDHLQTKHRLKVNFESENNPIFTARNKKSASFLTNKRRNMVRLLSKKKLKRFTISNKNKRLTKVQTNPSSLKHPESYPIIKQTVSSEKVRCVVESLRDNKASHGSTPATDEKYIETCEPSFEINLIETIELPKEPKQGRIIKTEGRDQVEVEGQQQLEIPSNELIPAGSNPEQNNVAESEPSAIGSDIQIVDPQINYTSINRVDNFVIMVDASGAHVEIKYADLPTSYNNENAVVQNHAELEGFDKAHSTPLEETEQDYEDLDYIESKNCTANTKGKVVSPRFQSTNLYTNMSSKQVGAHVEHFQVAADDVLRPNLSQSDQDGIIDLSMKETAVDIQPVPVVFPSTSSGLINRSSMYKNGINPNTLGIEPTVYRPSLHLLPAHQTVLPYNRQLNDRSRIFAKNASTSISQTCCNHCCSIESPKHNANTHPKQPIRFTQPHLKSLPPHYYHFSQQSTHLETPPISPGDQPWVPTPPKINFPITDLQQGLRNGSVPTASETFANSPGNAMSNELTYATYKNTVYPYAQHLKKKIRKSRNETRQLQHFGTRSFVTHHFDQMRQSPQNEQLIRPRFPQQQYNHIQQNHIGYAFQMNSELDLPQQFYNPLPENLLSNPNQSRTQSAFFTPNVVFESKDPWRFPNRPNIIPQVRFDPSQNYLPPTPSTTDRWFPPEQSMLKSFPYPSPNWANTLYNCSSRSLKSQICWNQPHPYTNQSKLPSETERIRRPHTSASSMRPTNALISRTNDNIWPSAHLQMQVPSHFNLNYL